MKQYILRIKAENEEIKNWYRNHSHYNKGDSGIDLFCKVSQLIQGNLTEKIMFGIACEVICIDGDKKYNVSYLLLPRSSIVKTPLRLSNSIGLIDSFYRNHISAICDNIKSTDYQITKKDRLFQLVNANLVPFSKIEVVDKFEDERKNRSGGFGSTGK